jgi:predicted DsbA family dithiol-disulfide isomerase
MQSIHVEYFTDMLCIWAYSAQVRLDHLKKSFPRQVKLTYRFTPIFAAVHERIESGWQEKGGFEAYNAHQLETAKGWDHVDLHPGIWLDTVPTTSLVSHLFLKAAQLLEQEGHPAFTAQSPVAGHSIFESLMWRVRCAFFEHCRDISDISVLCAITDEMDLPTADIVDRIDHGQAHAALHVDSEVRSKYMVSGSPTYVFNEGRQRLYGNVGYRIIHANIEELLRHPDSGEASWC